MSNLVCKIIVGASLFFFILFSLVTIEYGRLHVDEGFYFITPWLVAGGAMPYGDFIYTQTPLHAYVYSFLYRLGLTPDYWETRFFSFLLGFATILLALQLTLRLSGWPAVVIAAGILCLNGFMVYMFCLAKLYPLAAFLLTAGISLALSHRQRTAMLSLASLCLTLALCARISMFPAVAVFLAYLLISRGFFSRQFLIPFLVAIITGVAVLGPFWWLFPEQFLYSVFLYNYTKDIQPLWMSVMLRFDVLSKMAHEFFMGLLLGFLVLLAMVHHLRGILTRERWIPAMSAILKQLEPARVLLWLICLAVAGLQAVSKSGVVDEYLTPVIPLIAVLLAWESLRAVRYFTGKAATGLVFGLILFGCLLNLAAYGRTSLTLMDGKSPIKYLNEVADYLKSVTGKGDLILSFNNSLVVLADRRIVPGYEMHSATYDSTWDDDRCRKFRILSLGMIEQLLRMRQIRAVVIAENAFIGRFPDFYNPGDIQMRDRIMTLLENNYVKSRHYPELGYLGTDADVYLSRDESLK